jgi:hypothetical protein
MEPQLERTVRIRRTVHFAWPRFAVVAATVLIIGLLVLVGGLGVVIGKQRSPTSGDRQLAAAVLRQDACMREREELFRMMVDFERIQKVSARYDTHRMRCPVDVELSSLWRDRLHLEGACDTVSSVPCTVDHHMIGDLVAAVEDDVTTCAEGYEVTGKVKVRVHVGADGVVDSATPISTPDEGLGECVASTLIAAELEPTQIGGTFVYTFEP